MKNSITQILQRNTTHFSDIRTLNMRNICLQTYGKKMAPTSFSPVTSTNVGNSPQNFLTFSFKPFCHTSVKFQVHT